MITNSQEIPLPSSKLDIKSLALRALDDNIWMLLALRDSQIRTFSIVKPEISKQESQEFLRLSGYDDITNLIELLKLKKIWVEKCPYILTPEHTQQETLHFFHTFEKYLEPWNLSWTVAAELLEMSFSNEYISESGMSEIYSLFLSKEPLGVDLLTIFEGYGHCKLTLCLTPKNSFAFMYRLPGCSLLRDVRKCVEIVANTYGVGRHVPEIYQALLPDQLFELSIGELFKDLDGIHRWAAENIQKLGEDFRWEY